MSPSDRPLYERISDAADAVTELAEMDRWVGITDQLAEGLHKVASQLQTEAIEAAQLDQLLEDIAVWLYEHLERCCRNPQPCTKWVDLPPNHPVRHKYRNAATDMRDSFAVDHYPTPPF